jgi:hypothetical protein
MLFKEIIAVYSEKHAKPINTKCRHSDSRRYTQLPLGFKGLKQIFKKLSTIQSPC